MLIFLSTAIYAQRGCCSWHGGVAGCDPNTGREICVDNTDSPSCTCATNYAATSTLPKTNPSTLTMNQITNLDMNSMKLYCEMNEASCKAFLSGFILGTYDISHFYKPKNPATLNSEITLFIPCFGDKKNSINQKTLTFNRNLISTDVNGIYTNYLNFLTKKISNSNFQEINSTRAMDYTLEFLATYYSCPFSNDDLV